jgi:cytochrome oxidase assembly protein ShyY1
VTGSHYVAQAGLELAIPLAQPTKCWDYRHVTVSDQFLPDEKLLEKVGLLLVSEHMYKLT